MNPELKIYNKEINKRRIGIEHVFGRLKIFKILAERYRNRGKRLGFRFNLIAGIYNLELSKKRLMKEVSCTLIYFSYIVFKSRLKVSLQVKQGKQ